MSVTQTIEIPDSHRLTIDVPREVPTGPVVLTFTPASKRTLTDEEETEYIKQNAEWLNKQSEEDLEFQDIDAIYDDLERLTPQMLEVMRDTIVPINLADLMSSHDREG
jgi:chromosome condensin MukBEF complex kleisin-like MukF subunit